MVAVYFFRQDLAFPRSVLLVHAALNGRCSSVGASRAGRSWDDTRAGASSSSAPATAQARVIETIRTQRWLGMDIVGAVAMNGHGRCSSGGAADVPIVGRPRGACPRLCETYAADEVHHRVGGRLAGSHARSRSVAGRRARPDLRGAVARTRS
jgi:hypothetical protein